MNGSFAAFLIIIGLILLVACIFMAIVKIKRKQVEYVSKTSQKLKKIDELNIFFKNKFGSISSCDLKVAASFKYKRTFEHFCDDGCKIAKYLFDYQKTITQSLVNILKNNSAIGLYREETNKIKNERSSNIQTKYFLTLNKYVMLERKLLATKIYKPPLDFVVTVIAVYSSEKGYSNYRHEIKCGSGWIIESFLKYGNIDLLQRAEMVIKGIPYEHVAVPNVAITIEPIKPKRYDHDLSYKELLEMKYADVVAYLLSKYGKVPGDYFVNETCKTRNQKISRTSEGLFIHHIDEDKAIMLSTDKYAINNPFKYQKADRLVYCNILEHLILHVKISEEPRNIHANKNELPGIGGAINFICVQINDCYGDYPYKQQMMIRSREIIKDSFDDYILVLKRLLSIIQSNPVYSMFFNKEKLCLGYEGHVIEKVYNALN